MRSLRSLLLLAALAAPAHGADGQAVPAPESLLRLLPGFTADRVEATAIPGLYRVYFGPRLVYVSADGRYLLQGDLIDLQTRSNLTDVALREARAGVIAALDTSAMIEFAPESPRHTVTVFTDIDCPYCVKLHSEMAAYNALGISVRYLAFPRAGLGSSSYRKSVSVWCAPDRRQAITDAKAGNEVAPASCENPVAAQYRLGREMGVTGTPTIVLDDGRLLPGYVPAAELMRRIEHPSG